MSLRRRHFHSQFSEEEAEAQSGKSWVTHSRLPRSQKQSCSSTWGSPGLVEGGCHGAQGTKPGLGVLSCGVQGDRMRCHPALDLLLFPGTGAILLGNMSAGGGEA